ncbi:MAG: adenosine deaminase [Pseudomonadota bacterium]
MNKKHVLFSYSVPLILGLSTTLMNAAKVYAKTLSSETTSASIHKNQAMTEHYYNYLISDQSSTLPALILLMNRIPKGADLHHHYSGALYAETYLKWVGEKQYCIYKDYLPSLKIEKYTVEKQAFDTLSEASKNICLKADMIYRNTDFYRELLSQWSDSNYDSAYASKTPPDQHFFDTFKYFNDISELNYSAGLEELKTRAKNENVQYLETMLKSAPSFTPAEFENKINALNAESSEDEINELLEKFSAFLNTNTEFKSKISAYISMLEQASRDIDDEEFTLRFQSYASRNNPPIKVFSSLYGAFLAAQSTPKIVGINLVGPENGYVAMRDYSLHMKMFQFLKKRFPHTPLALHAGELSLGMVPPEGLTHHINEAVHIASANRIGHGVDIVHETNAYSLLKTMKEKNVVVEINLSSNAFILGIQKETHPITLYQNYNIPIVISSDDAGISRNNLSQEYFLFTSRYKPSYQTLKKVIYNSIHYSFLSPSNKTRELKKLDKNFQVFEAIIAENIKNTTLYPMSKMKPSTNY